MHVQKWIGGTNQSMNNNAMRGLPVSTYLSMLLAIWTLEQSAREKKYCAIILSNSTCLGKASLIVFIHLDIGISPS